MTENERVFFNELSSMRRKATELFQQSFLRGIYASIVDKYSDSAHFVYELLQNADDAKATDVRFVLKKDRLIFIHNGERKFSISDPKTEDEDRKRNLLGDLNAITSIGQSTKQDDTNTIGKFGVGFKAVFQYTSTPEIHDDNFHFKLEDLIVPTLLNEDAPEREVNETAFILPFKNEVSESAYRDIQLKLEQLTFPLLFLSNLTTLKFDIREITKTYNKKVVRKLNDEDLIAEEIYVTTSQDGQLVEKHLWLFSRFLRDKELPYSIVFFVDDKGNLVPAQNLPAFCYFPTREQTALNFLIHAPFLLTDSREGIKAKNEHNQELVKRLANLSVDSILKLKEIGLCDNKRLITDGIINIIPTQANSFSNENDGNRISFRPFYTDIRKLFSSEEILPTQEGYTSSKYAFWAGSRQIERLFSNQQLEVLVNHKGAKWVFPSFARDSQKIASHASEYIKSLVITYLDDIYLLKGGSYWQNSKFKYNGIHNNFIEQQDVAWLHRLYEWIAASEERVDTVKTLPIFLNQKREASAAFDEDENVLLFLPLANTVKGYNFILDELLKNEKTKTFIEKTIGLTTPSRFDYIRTVLLKEYDSDEEIDVLSHFEIIFEYYESCNRTSASELIECLKDYDWLQYFDQKANEDLRTSASELYFPTEELEVYFETSTDIKFINYQNYLDIVGCEKQDTLDDFFEELGVSKVARIKKREIDYSEVKERDLPYWKGTFDISHSENVIEGCKDIVDFILDENNEFNERKNKSIILWNTLLEVAQVVKDSFQSILKGEYKYKYYHVRTKEFESSTTILLQESKWMFTNNDRTVIPQQMSQTNLPNWYRTNSSSIKDVFNYLGVKENEGLSNLTEAQQKKLADAEKINALLAKHNSSYEEIEQLLEKRNQKTPGQTSSNYRHREVLTDEEYEGQDITRLTKNDISKKLRQEEIYYQNKVENLEISNKLYEAFNNSKKYSFAWFKKLLELERHLSAEKCTSKETSITFHEVQLEPSNNNILILKNPNRPIPQRIEEFSDIPLALCFRNETKEFTIEVSNIKSYTLRVKLRGAHNLTEDQLELINLAKIEIKNASFLLDELYQQFCKLNCEDTDNLQLALCENIEFVFGPPGTGKTTYLANTVIPSLIQTQTSMKCKILVLTPTNKAADVLTRRIMDCVPKSEQWLIRFATTNDEVIEKNRIRKDKVFDFNALSKCVTVATIARFPYDFFLCNNQKTYLRDIAWDYIIIDEASMIPLANIVYPLFKQTPQKFIIAGDPFQIEPIVNIQECQNENIYTFVNLNSFKATNTIPHQYPIIRLKTQYRSIPLIGEVFSKFLYDGALKHHRSAAKYLTLDSKKKICPLNILKFPNFRYESIYQPKQLNGGSSYHIYAALFTFEYVGYLAKHLEPNSNSHIRIGIITPYRAQGTLIDNLISRVSYPKHIDIQVGTIHSFQGDECDIVFVVFNTPPSISSSEKVFANKKNIINVAISRARDSLFIVIPDDETENVQALTNIKRIEALIKETTQESAYTEILTPTIENELFKDSKYFENNVFSTGHQDVNIYDVPVAKYEVRTEDSAIDIQLRNIAESTTQIDNPTQTNDVIPQSSLMVGAQLVTGQDLNKSSSTSLGTCKGIQIRTSGVFNGTIQLIPIDHIPKEGTIPLFTQFKGGYRMMIHWCQKTQRLYVLKDTFKLFESKIRAKNMFHLTRK